MNSAAVSLDRQITEQLNVLNVRQKKVLLAVAKTFALESPAGKHKNPPKGKASALRGKLSPMTNEQIDQQLNDLRNGIRS